jgi:hypothetical protein
MLAVPFATCCERPIPNMLWIDDVFCNGAVVGRIFKANAAPPWMWAFIFPHQEGRNARLSMAAFANSWRAGVDTPPVLHSLPDINEPLPPKSKWTRRRTYQRIRNEIQSLEAKTNARRFRKPLSPRVFAYHIG